MPRRKATRGTAHVGDALSPPPTIPEPQKTETEIAKDRHQTAEFLRLVGDFVEDARQANLDRAVRLAQMAARRQGPLVEFFRQVGMQYRELADNGAPKRPALRVIEGEGGRP